MPDSEVDRYRRVAGHVRKKLVSMALAHKHVRPPPEEVGPQTDAGESQEHEFGIRSDPKAAAEVEGASDDKGSVPGADEHMHPDLQEGHLPEPADKGSLYPKLQLGNSKQEHVKMEGHQPEKAELASPVEEHTVYESTQHHNVPGPHGHKGELATEHLASKHTEPKSGSEDHGWAEHETDAEHSAEPDSERMQAEDPGSGEADWQAMMKSRRIGKTAKGIIGAYKGGR